MVYSPRSLFFLLVPLLFFTPSLVYGAQASLVIAPKDGIYVVGNEFTVGIVLDTGGVSVNAVEGKIRYLPDDLTVVKVEKGATPVTSWTVEPDYTTETGLISFGGVNPDGIKGKGKTLFSITFRVLRSGEARIRPASGAAILAEGGAGTNILTDLRGGTYTLVSEKDHVEAQHGGPSLLRSSSHPDESAWYKTPDVSFEWSRSPDTDQVRFSVDQNPEGAPTGTLDGNTEGKTMTLGDGIWYGHLALHDDSGWSPIGHLRVEIDTGRPESLRVLEIPRANPEDPHPTISFEASDVRSGISHYEIAIDGANPLRWEDDGNHRYQLPTLSPGDHVVSARVFDRAGNSVAETLVVHVEGLPTPVVEPVPSVLSVGGEIDLEGTVGEGMSARVSIGFEGGESRTEDVASGPGGAFIHTFQFPKEGVYRLRVQAIDQRGATSEWTPEIAVQVTARSFLGAIGSVGDGGGGILMSLVFLVVGVFVGLWYGKNTGRVATFAPVALSEAENPYPASRIRAFSGKVLGVAATLLGYGKQLFSRKTSAPEEGAPLEYEEDVPPQTRSVLRSQGGGENNRSTHTISLRRKVEEVPPHRPTILGR